ncbi:MAG: beta-galactosidase [Ruminococcaceae bacterium]|nr:beta-galactosidase [Oscillospiraceae bacterium]
MSNIPRSEYPKPQFYRANHKILNGEWDFYIDKSDTGDKRGYFKPETEFDMKITVPFCPESILSGVNHKDFMDAVWYKRKIDITKEQLEGRVILNFGAVDYIATVYVNGYYVGVHKGGYVSFAFDITKQLHEGENVIVLRAQDYVRKMNQPAGKQSTLYESYGCHYTRTTGIWQTVWLDFVPKTYLKSIKTDADARLGDVLFDVVTAGDDVSGTELDIKVSFAGKTVAEKKASLNYGSTKVSLNVPSPILWDVGKGNLYDVEYILSANGKETEKVTSYIGFRTVELKNDGLYINGRPVYQRLVLDQGFYHDGIYTAPTDDILRGDIELSMAVGFNGARLHEKIFEERFLYWADKLGYIVWEEHANWGCDLSRTENVIGFAEEWMEAVKRDYNHPAIIGWAPFNETWDQNRREQDKNAVALVFHITKSLDSTRPVIDTSGGYHVADITDIYDIHDYEQNVEKWEEKYLNIPDGKVVETLAGRQYYSGQPYFLSEYGGSWWAPGRTDGWGYGNAPKTVEELGERYYGLTTTLLKQKRLCGFCYTQLTDVEQEQNGLYTFERKRKFPDEIYDRIREANTYPAAFEEEK